MLQYERLLEILEETKTSRTELMSAVRKLSTSQSDTEVANQLPLISMDAFVQHEATLQPGDSVSVFANTLETDYKPMFDTVVANLKNGVVYRYILFETDQADEWDKFLRMLSKNGVTEIPLVAFTPRVLCPQNVPRT